MKSRAWVAVFCLVTLHLLAQPRNCAPQNANKPADHQNSATKGEATNSSPPRWYSPLKRPDWWFVIVAALTAGFICWQSRETRRAAIAAMLNARAIIDAERSWIITSAGRKKGTAMSETTFTLENHGKTPARLLSLKYRPHLVESMDDLPAVPDYGNTSVPATHLLAPNQTWDFIVFMPSDHFSNAELNVPSYPQAHPKILFLYGVVQYRDIFSESTIHETAFCYRRDWNTRWVLDGPSGYNNYT